MKASTDLVREQNSRKFEPLFDKATHVREALNEYYY